MEDGRHSGWWTGMLVFAASMLVLVGIFNIIDGLVALFNDQFFLVTKSSLITFDFTTWGWIMLALGSVAVLAGIGVLSGKTWARVFGVIIAGLNAIAQISFVSAYPVWSVVIIAMDVLIIWALTAHGRELTQ